MGKYKLTTHHHTKILHVELEGSFSAEDGLNSIQSYQQTVNPIPTTEYELHIDCRKLAVTRRQVMPVLEECFNMFKSDGFTKVVLLVLGDNPTLKMQLARMGRQTELDTLVIVEAA